MWSFKFLTHPRGGCKAEMTDPEACLGLAALNLFPYTGVSGCAIRNEPLLLRTRG